MGLLSMGNIKNGESVILPPELIEEAQRREDDPDVILRLVDLIFAMRPEDRLPS